MWSTNMPPGGGQGIGDDTQMTDPPGSSGAGDDQDTRYDRESTTGIPRWVKLVGIVVAILVLLVVVMMLVGGIGRHNPLRHVGEPGEAPPASVAGGGHTAPEDGHVPSALVRG
jgi:Na+-transporting methylmalonyl-CoA/oxaloacetate decarboxylase gamma subunit